MSRFRVHLFRRATCLESFLSENKGLTNFSKLVHLQFVYISGKSLYDQAYIFSLCFSWGPKGRVLHYSMSNGGPYWKNAWVAVWSQKYHEVRGNIINEFPQRKSFGFERFNELPRPNLKKRFRCFSFVYLFCQLLWICQRLRVRSCFNLIILQ